jgi:ABC-2 type transport system ATP-binding protein
LKIIEVKNLVKSFDDFNAVNSISFDVEKREVFGFLGPNGAGKTTTINMLTGLARPTSGEITIAGYDGIKHIKKVQQLIGIVPDESNLYDEMSGFDNLTFCASLYGMKKEVREERAKELLKQFSLEDTGDRPFKAYSKGMKRKLTIAAGIIHNPEILFLDEPTTGIDVESARQIRKMIKNLNDNGTTIFLTTHYIEEAERLCDRIGFIVGGKVIKVSKVQDLMIEAQQENIVEFGIDSNGLNVEKLLTGNFPDITIKSLQSIPQRQTLKASLHRINQQ